jgi:hypothetical protein
MRDSSSWKRRRRKNKIITLKGKQEIEGENYSDDDYRSGCCAPIGL